MEERFDYDGLLGVNSDLREQLADAQATVEALQRERDALKLVNETHMKTVMKLSHIVEQSGAALDATTPAEQHDPVGEAAIIWADELLKGGDGE